MSAVQNAIKGSTRISNFPIISISINNFHDRVLCCQPTNMPTSIFGWLVCNYCATSWFWWKVGWALWYGDAFRGITKSRDRPWTIQWKCMWIYVYQFIHKCGPPLHYPPTMTYKPSTSPRVLADMSVMNTLIVLRICLTHWGRDKIAAISQTTFSNAFSWMKMFEFRLKFHWSLFLRVQLIISQHWFR